MWSSLSCGLRFIVAERIGFHKNESVQQFFFVFVLSRKATREETGVCLVLTIGGVGIKPFQVKLY